MALLLQAGHLFQAPSLVPEDGGFCAPPPDKPDTLFVHDQPGHGKAPPYPKDRPANHDEEPGQEAERHDPGQPIRGRRLFNQVKGQGK